MIKPDRDWIAQGRLVGADFEEKTLEFRITGDMPKMLVSGRYVVAPAEAFDSLLRRATLWNNSQKPAA